MQEAIARHYNEERPKYDGLFRRPENPSKSYLLLRPEFWRGQQHGGRHDAVHARHMRPRCDIISTGTQINALVKVRTKLSKIRIIWKILQRILSCL
jgi:hypothetical protein